MFSGKESGPGGVEDEDDDEDEDDSPLSSVVCHLSSLAAACRDGGSVMLGFRVQSTMRMGLKSLCLHKLRSFLTVLGIICGVCSVIAMLAIGEGASFEAQEQIRQLGSNNIIVNRF